MDKIMYLVTSSGGAASIIWAMSETNAIDIYKRTVPGPHHEITVVLPTFSPSERIYLDAAGQIRLKTVR